MWKKLTLWQQRKKKLDLHKMKSYWSPCWWLNGKGSQGAKVLTELFLLSASWSAEEGPFRGKTLLSIYEQGLLSLGTEPGVRWAWELQQPVQRYPGSTGKLSTAALPAGGTLGKYPRGVGWVWWQCLCCFNDTCVQRPVRLSSISHQSDIHRTDIA